MRMVPEEEFSIRLEAISLQTAQTIINYMVGLKEIACLH